MIYVIRLTNEQLERMGERLGDMLLHRLSGPWDKGTWDLWRMTSRLLESHREVSRLLAVYEGQEAAGRLWFHLESGEPGVSG